MRQLEFLGRTLGAIPAGSVQQTPPQSFLESPGGQAAISAGTLALLGMSDERYKEEIALEKAQLRIKVKKEEV